MGQNAGYPFYKGWKANGTSPAVGYYLYTYESGGTIPKTTYSDSDLATPNSNPIVLNGSGEATIFLGSGAYRFDLKTPTGALINTFDPIQGAGVTIDAVETIASLKSLSPQGNLTLVNVLGYYSANDGGGGTFYFDASSSAVDNGGTIIAPGSVPSSGRWLRIYSDELTPDMFGAVHDGVTDDQSVFEVTADVCYLQGLVFKIPKKLYYLSSWRINGFTAGLQIEGSGPQTKLTFGAEAYGLLIDGGTRKLVMKDLQLSFPNAVAQDCFRLGSNAGSSQAYECSFHNIYMQGNSASSLQRGLVIEQAYIHQFYDCWILNFGYNVTFKTEANSCNFYGCSIRANQTNNILLVDAQSGQENTFYGGDVENAVSWIKNTACEGLIFDGVYMEASLGVAIELVAGFTSFHKCFLSEARVKIDTAGASSWVNNRVRKTGTSFFLYLVSSIGTCPFLYVSGNKVEYTNPATQGLFIRGFSTGLQYFDASLVLVGNVVTYNYLSIDQERIYDVDTSSVKHFIITKADAASFNGPVDANLGASRMRTLSLTQATGVAPMTVASTTVVSNLNADLLDGLDSVLFARRAANSGNVTAGTDWYRFATNGTVAVGGTGHTRAGALFTIYDTTGGQHAIATFYAGILFGNQPTIVLLTNYAYTSRRLDKIRIVYSTSVGSGEGAAIDLHITGGASEELKVVCYDNEATTGWSTQVPTAGATIPGAPYTSVELDLASNEPIMAISAGSLSNVWGVRRDGRIFSGQVPTAVVPAQRYLVHYKLAGVDLNSAATDVATFTGLPSKYRVLRLTVFDASISLTTATFDLRTAAAGAGTALVAAYAPSGCTAAAKTVDATLAAVAGTDYQTSGTLYVRNVTAQGAAATASFLLEIQEIT